MGILGWIVFGLIVGALAKLVMPGKDPGGWIVTTLLGIVGAVVGGFLGRMLGLYQEGEPAGFVGALLGAILVLWIYRKTRKGPDPGGRGPPPAGASIGDNGRVSGTSGGTRATPPGRLFSPGRMCPFVALAALGGVYCIWTLTSRLPVGGALLPQRSDLHPRRPGWSSRWPFGRAARPAWMTRRDAPGGS